jgi:S4 domain
MARKSTSLKKRLDLLLVERGIASSRQRAQALILARHVLVNGQRADKAGMPVAGHAPQVGRLRFPTFRAVSPARLFRRLTVTFASALQSEAHIPLVA